MDDSLCQKFRGTSIFFLSENHGLQYDVFFINKLLPVKFSFFLSRRSDYNCYPADLQICTALVFKNKIFSSCAVISSATEQECI